MYDGQRVLDLLADAPPDYPHLDELQKRAQAEVERQKGLEEARKAYDGQRVLDLLVDAPPDYPHLDELREWAETWGGHRSDLEDRWQAGQWEEVLNLLKALPSDYPDRDRRIQEAEHSLWQQRRLEAAQAALDAGKLKEVVELCDRTIAEGGDASVFEGLRDRAQRELEADQEASRAAEEAEVHFQNGDLRQSLALLKHACSLRPQRADLQLRLKQVTWEWEREQRLEQARQAFDEDRWEDVLSLLEQLPPDDPDAEALRQNSRQLLADGLYARAEEAEKAGDVESALSVLRRLQSLQIGDETLAQRIGQLERELQARQALERAYAAQGGNKWSEVLADTEEVLSLFPDHEEARTLHDRAEQILAARRAQRRRLILRVGLPALVAMSIAIGLAAAHPWGPGSRSGTATPTTSGALLVTTATRRPIASPTPTETATVVISIPTATSVSVMTMSSPTPIPPTLTPVPPTATPAPTLKPEVIVRTDTLNVRAGPSTLHPIIHEVSRGTRLDVIGRTPDTTWWQIRLEDGTVGWVYAKLVKGAGPIGDVKVAQDIPTPPPTFTPTSTPTNTPVPPSPTPKPKPKPTRRPPTPTPTRRPPTSTPKPTRRPPTPTPAPL